MLLTTFGDRRLRLNFNDVPHSLLALRRKVLPGFRLEKCLGVVCTVPHGHGYLRGSGRALYVENLAVQGAHGVTMGIGYRLPGGIEVAGRDCRTAIGTISPML